MPYQEERRRQGPPQGGQTPTVNFDGGELPVVKVQWQTIKVHCHRTEGTRKPMMEMSVRGSVSRSDLARMGQVTSHFWQIWCIDTRQRPVSCTTPSAEPVTITRADGTRRPRRRGRPCAPSPSPAGRTIGPPDRSRARRSPHHPVRLNEDTHQGLGPIPPPTPGISLCYFRRVEVLAVARVSPVHDRPSAAPARE